MRRKIVFQDPQSNLRVNFGLEEKECAAETKARNRTLRKGKLKVKTKCGDDVTIFPQIGTLRVGFPVWREREGGRKKLLCQRGGWSE